MYNYEIVEKNEIKFSVVEIDMSQLYNLMPGSTSCRLFNILSNYYYELATAWINASIILNYSPDSIDIIKSNDIRLKEEEAKALVLLIHEIKDSTIDNTIDNIIAAIRFFIEFDIEKITNILENLKRVYRLYDGYESCYLLLLRD